MKIIELSETGFKTEERWFTCDKYKVLSQPLFKSLQIGDSVDNIEVNAKGYVIKYKVEKPSISNITLSGGSSLPKATVPKPFKHDSKLSAKGSYIDRNILKGQCLNIAFRDSTADLLGFNDEIDKRIKIAQDIFNKVEEANFYEW